MFKKKVESHSLPHSIWSQKETCRTRRMWDKRHKNDRTALCTSIKSHEGLYKCKSRQEWAETKRILTEILCNLGIEHLELFNSLLYGFLILQILLFFFSWGRQKYSSIIQWQILHKFMHLLFCWHKDEKLRYKKTTWGCYCQGIKRRKRTWVKKCP